MCYFEFRVARQAKKSDTRAGLSGDMVEWSLGCSDRTSVRSEEL